MGIPAAIGKHSVWVCAGNRPAVLAKRRMDPVRLDCVERIVCNGFLALLSGRVTVDGFRWFYVVEDWTKETGDGL